MKFILLCSTFLGFNLYAQTASEIFEQMRKERQEMFEKISKIFEEESLMDSFSGNDQFLGDFGFGKNESRVDIDKKYEEDGSILVYIKPQNKNAQLDIQTTDDSIKIISKMKTIEENSSDKASSSFYSTSSSTQVVPIPKGYSAKSPEKSKDGIVIKLVASSSSEKAKEKKNKRQSLLKLPDEDII